MARETRPRSGRVAKYGMCVNEECEKYKEVQEIIHGDFVCEKCGKPLTSCPPPANRGGKGKMIGIISGAVALLAIICIFIFSGGSKVEKLTLDKTQLTLKVGQTDELKVAIEPEEAQPQLLWQSTNDSVISVANGVVTGLKAGKAQVKVLVMDNEVISAICEYTVVDNDVDMRTLDIVEDPIILRPGGHQQLTVNFTPEDQTEMILWSSSNDSVVKVSPRGKIEAVGVGGALIIARSERTGIADTASVSVEGPAEMPEEKASQTKASAPQPAAAPAPKPTPKPAPASSGSKNLGYATFKGSWPNDVNGRMVFTSSHIIDGKDPKKRVAEAGDYVIGEWSDGHLVQGIWYGADNQVKGSIIIGK